jgi:hypothetical protein
MTNVTPRNTSQTESSEKVEPALPAEDAMRGSGTSRRDALAALAKHAAYTAPAVLTILSLTTKRAAAGSF